MAPSPGSHRERRWLPGQVIVEMLLILPVFMTIIFHIMEMGNLAFQMILINHATWEVARIGAMTATSNDGKSTSPKRQELQNVLSRIVATARVLRAEPQTTIPDKQEGGMNSDLVVTTLYPVPLIFPISNFMMSKPKGSGHRDVVVEVRMPIERPLIK